MPPTSRLGNHIFQDDSDRLDAEWLSFKCVIQEWANDLPPYLTEKGASPSAPIEWCLMKVLTTRGLDTAYPLVSMLAEISLSIQVSNALPERGCSKVKLIKPRLRSSMKNDLLNSLLHININGSPLFTKELDAFIKQSVKAWKATGWKMLLKAGGRKPIITPKTSICPVATQSVSTQTQTEIKLNVPCL